ncbi:MAG: hypothetical protein ACOCTG_03170 [Bacteroidota bacterium]
MFLLAGILLLFVPFDHLSSDTLAIDDPPPVLEVDIGGALRFNYVVSNWNDANLDRGGDFLFDTFRLNASARYGDLLLAAEYRFYAGYHMLKTGSVGYRLGEHTTVDFGIHQVPFGITEYASNSWFFQIPYYLGMEDDHDAGVRVRYRRGPLSLDGAFYKNAEGPFTGSSLASARYSYDVVPSASGALDYGPNPVAGATFNQETNQVNAKAAYTLGSGTASSIEIGASTQYGGLYNLSTRKTGYHAAAAVHVDASWHRFNLKLEWIRYDHAPENPEGQSDKFVVMGAYDFPYRVASSGAMYVGGLSYTLPVDAGPVSFVTVYNDFSYLDKAPDQWHDTIQNIAGTLIGAGPLFVYTDFVYARNHPFAIPGADFAAALAEGTDEWHVRFNVNVGFYF